LIEPYYEDFLASKLKTIHPVGIDVPDSAVHEMLFPFQKAITRWALKRGRCAVFADTGLGKTFIQLEWARLIGETVLIFAPLSVARQTVREGKKIGLTVHPVRSAGEIQTGINITNYENIEHFKDCAGGLNAVILDESSILKALDGKTRRKLITYFQKVPYRLCCTATPAPNDHTELGNHAEFLGICTMAEMLSTYFVNGNKTTETAISDGIILRKKHSNKHGQQWRLRYHAQYDYYRWLSSWAMAIRKPSDLGFEDDGYKLPKLNIIPVMVDANYVPDDELFFSGLKGIGQRAQVRRSTADAKAVKVFELVKTDSSQWLIWCGLDRESEMARIAIKDAVEVKGADSQDHKTQSFEDFQDKKARVLISKPKIGGFGMNFQNCHNMIFFGLNDSWESFYQCVRRCYRFGQKKPVNVYVVISDIETQIYENILRKGEMSERMMNGLIDQVKEHEKAELGLSEQKPTTEYREETITGTDFKAMMGDSCSRLKEVESDSIDLTVYSPPFADLYTYSATERDLGNSRNWDEFFSHYQFIIGELLRVTRPGRLSCVHTADIPAMQMKDGYIGIRDFPGAVIAAHINAGWIFHGRITIDKNPQAQATRTKAKALLFHQTEKDSSDSRPGIPDYMLVFKKPGENRVPITPGKHGEMTRRDWILWARPVWYAADYEPGTHKLYSGTGNDSFKSGAATSDGIGETDTLQYTTARDKDDEKHICPLQLGTIERCIKLWSNPRETVLTPFGGIGSEAYQAIRLNRKALLIELKPSYFRIAVQNLRGAEDQRTQIQMAI
jgi:DNA modification methylase